MSRPKLEPGDLVHVVADNAYGGTGVLVDLYYEGRHSDWRTGIVLLDGALETFGAWQLERAEEE